MSAVDSSPISVHTGAPERRRRTNLRQSLRAMRDNASTAYAPEDFSADIIAPRILWRRMFVINEPEAIRHILLDPRRTTRSRKLDGAFSSLRLAAGF
jgi:hypothetical protein